MIGNAAESLQALGKVSAIAVFEKLQADKAAATGFRTYVERSNK